MFLLNLVFYLIKEGAYLNSPKGQSEMAEAISNAVINYKNEFFNNLITSNPSESNNNEISYYRIQIAASNKLLELNPIILMA